VRLACLGGAAVASATVGDTQMLAKLTASAEEIMSPTAFPFETASALRSLYQAHELAGEDVTAEEYRVRARSLARRNGFFEVVLATEGRAVETPRAHSTPLSEESLGVIQSLEMLEPEPNALALAATLPG